MIRKKYFIPFVILVLSLTIFRYFFLDNLIKYSIEKSFSAIPKLIVQIDSLKLQILKGDMTINGMAFIWENSEKANYIDKIIFDINTPQLLRAKFVINDMEMLGIRTVAKDQLVWSPKIKKESQAKKVALRLAGSVLSYYSAEKIGERLEVNKLLDVSQAKFTETLNSELSEIRASYDNLQKILASDDLEKRLKELESAIKTLEQNKPIDFMKIPQYIQDISSLKNQYDQVKKAYEYKQSAITQFQNRISLSSKKIDEAGKLDMALLNSKIKFADQKKQSLVTDIIGVEVKKYVEIANKGIAVVKVLRGDKPKQKRNQFKGVDIAFPIKDTYPVFYIKQLKLEGVDTQGNIFKGRGNNITNKQTIRNLPSRLELFQDYGSSASFVGITLDLREDVKVLVNGFISNHELKDKYWDTVQFPLLISDGKYDVNMNFGYVKNTISSLVRLKTTGLKLTVDPSLENRSVLEKYFFESLSEIPYFALDIRLDGDKLGIDTNVDEYMMSATQKLINKEIEKVVQNYATQWQSFVKQQEENFKKEVEKLVI